MVDTRDKKTLEKARVVAASSISAKERDVKVIEKERRASEHGIPPPPPQKVAAGKSTNDRSLFS